MTTHILKEYGTKGERNQVSVFTQEINFPKSLMLKFQSVLLWKLEFQPFSFAGTCEQTNSKRSHLCLNKGIFHELFVFI